MPWPRVKRGTAALKVVSACESSDMVQAKEGELGLNQIGYGHDVNMYVCLHACEAKSVKSVKSIKSVKSVSESVS